MRSLTLISCLLLVLACAEASARDLYVRVSGSDSNPGTSPDRAFRTLEHSFARLRAGDTLYVGAGTYTDTTIRVEHAGTVDQPILIIADTTGEHTGDAGTVLHTRNTTQQTVRLINADFVTIRGWRFEGGQDSIWIDSSESVTIEDCVFVNVRDSAVVIHNGGSAEVLGCQIEGGKHGVKVSNGQASVSDTHIVGVANAALQVDNTDCVLEVRRTQIIGAQRGLYAMNGTVTLINTLIHDTAIEGVYTRNQTRLVMINCTVDTTVREGVRFQGTTTLHNNIFSNIGTHCTRYDGGTWTVSDNLMFNRGGNKSNMYNSPREHEFDPLYTNRDADDFSLLPGSPARDLGMLVSEITELDLFGKPRPEGDGYDLGAVEGSHAPKRFFVATTGSDASDGLTPATAFRTIQHAAANCTSPGSTVYVAPGTYHETIQIGTGLGAAASSASRENPTRIIADVSGVNTSSEPGPVVLDGQESRARAIQSIDRQFWSFEGFVFENYTDYIAHVTRGGMSFESCRFEVPNSFAIYSTPTSDLGVTNSEFIRSATSGHMIWAWNITTGTDSKLTIIGNRMAALGERYLASRYWEGFSSQTTYDSINYSYAIVAYNAGSAGGESIEITNNIVSDTYLPIYAYGRSANGQSVVANNTITGSTYSIWSYHTGGSEAFVVNNIISGVYYGLFATGPTQVEGLLEHGVTYDMSRYNRTYLPTIVVTDGPALFDPASGDFSLQAGSPAIDAGTARFAPGTDIDGRSRPSDSDNDGVAAHNLGAVELVTGVLERRVVRWREVSPIGED